MPPVCRWCNIKIFETLSPTAKDVFLISEKDSILIFGGSSSIRSSAAKMLDGFSEPFVGLHIIVRNSSKIAFWTFSPWGLRTVAGKRCSCLQWAVYDQIPFYASFSSLLRLSICAVPTRLPKCAAGATWGLHLWIDGRGGDCREIFERTTVPEAKTGSLVTCTGTHARWFLLILYISL